MAYVVVVKFKIDTKYFDDFIKLMKINAKDSLQEDGCIQFDISFKDDTVFLYEVYKDEEAFDIHLKSEHYKKFQNVTKSLILVKEVNTYLLIS